MIGQHIPFFSLFPFFSGPGSQSQGLLIILSVMVSVSPDPGSFIPHVMNQNRTSFRCLKSRLSCKLIGFGIPYQLSVRKISIIGKKIIFGRQIKDFPFQSPIDGILITGKKAPPSALVKSKQPALCILLPPSFQVNQQNSGIDIGILISQSNVLLDLPVNRRFHDSPHKLPLQIHSPKPSKRLYSHCITVQIQYSSDVLRQKSSHKQPSHGTDIKSSCMHPEIKIISDIIKLNPFHLPVIPVCHRFQLLSAVHFNSHRKHIDNKPFLFFILFEHRSHGSRHVFHIIFI